MALSLTALGSSAPNSAPFVMSAASGALPAGGVIYITYAGGAGAYTLPAPTADGVDVFIQTLTAQAHVVTTPANVINAADDTATFGAAAFNMIKMRSFGGQWISNTAEKLNVTLTEV
jgi:hypothetical protein